MSDTSGKNLNRVVKALKKLETADDGKCAVCGAKTYRDACVVLRHGYWIAPASFHKSGCALDRVMREVVREVTPEEAEAEKQAHARIMKKMFGEL